MKPYLDGFAVPARRPWWVFRFPGLMPAVEERHLRVLGAVALLLILEE